MNISFVSDLVCPFCYIGFSQLQKALLASPVQEVSIGSLPFQLDPDVPEQGVPFQQYLAQRFGDNAQQVLDSATAMAAEEGLTLRFDLMETWPNTLKAHRLLALCPAELRLPLYETLFKALFSEGRDIGRAAVLVELAQGIGLAVDEAALDSAELVEQTNRMLNATLAMGVRSVPVTIFGEEQSLVGAQGTEAVVRMLATAQ